MNLELLQVSLKHSGSLFMYAGNEGGAYAKNSFGNMYVQIIFDALLFIFIFKFNWVLVLLIFLT